MKSTATPCVSNHEGVASVMMIDSTGTIADKAADGLLRRFAPRHDEKSGARMTGLTSR
jgi:hypothetical protein